MPDELVESAERAATKEQKRHKIWQHPDRELIHAMLRRGKSANWIALWLEDRYPMEDEEGEHPDAAKHKKWLLGPSTIDRYRKEFMPEVDPGQDVVLEDIEEVIGRRVPPPMGPQFELEMLETGIRIGEHNLARSLKSDEEMGMVQPQTLNAHSQFVDTVAKVIDVKAKLGLPGYEYVAEKHQIDQTNRNLSVELHGKVDSRTGQIVPNEPEKMEVLKQFLDLGPEKAHELMIAAAAEASRRAEENADQVEAEATEEVEDATVIPDDEELDGDAESPA